MDPNDNNNIFESVQLEIITVKAEMKQEPIENADITEEEVQNVTIDNSSDSTVSAHKRKHFEDNSLNVQEDERMSDTSSASKSIVKRRRYSDFQNEDSVSNSTPVLSEPVPASPGPAPQNREERQIYTLLVTSSPGEWTSQDVINYIKEQCGIHISKINDSREVNSEADFQIKLKFTNKDQLNRVLLKLKGKEVEGKLMTQVDDGHDEEQSDIESEAMVHIVGRETLEDPSSVLTQIVESDDNPFHLKEEYLESLGIKLPVTNWVTVTNFRCDKTELKEVLELCGKVLVCSVVMANSRYANVMYGHPLEAVQAISMLNGQNLYGKPLNLTMNNSLDMKTFLPKGLQNLGPGLGRYGKPLPDLADQYKNFLEGKTSTIDSRLFQPGWLSKLGVNLEDRSYVRPGNSSINDDSVSERSGESSPSVRSVQANQFGPIGQRPPRPRSTPINRPQFHNNPVTNYNNQPVLRTNSQVVPRGGNNAIPVQMQGPRAPNPNMAYQNCPPIPGAENDPRNFHNGAVRPGPMSGPIGHTCSMGPRPVGPIMGPSPRVAMPTNNRFAGPMSPMMGPRPVCPHVAQVATVGPVGPVCQTGHLGQVGPVGQVANVGQVGHQLAPRQGPNGPMPSQNVAGSNVRPSVSYMAQAGSGGCNVQMFKSNDPVTLQISNLPPSTNFVNLGQKLSELGHVVFLEFTTPGCAVVRFASPADAERCFQNYRKVLG